jgi:hypothetical protein
VLLAVIGGCAAGRPRDDGSAASRPAADGSGTPAVMRYQVRSNAGRYVVQFASSPDPIPMNEVFDLVIRVSEEGGAALDSREIQLRVDAAMPEHQHGMNRRPTFRANRDGTFTAAGMLFHMPGRWELYFDILRRGITERAQFEVNLE